MVRDIKIHKAFNMSTEGHKTYARVVKQNLLKPSQIKSQKGVNPLMRNDEGSTAIITSNVPVMTGTGMESRYV